MIFEGHSNCLEGHVLCVMILSLWLSGCPPVIFGCFCFPVGK